MTTPFGEPDGPVRIYPNTSLHRELREEQANSVLDWFRSNAIPPEGVTSSEAVEITGTHIDFWWIAARDKPSPTWPMTEARITADEPPQTRHLVELAVPLPADLERALRQIKARRIGGSPRATRCIRHRRCRRRERPVSRVYFHSPSGEVEIRGSERAWLSHLAGGIAQAAWDFTSVSHNLERAGQIMALVPEHEGSYIHEYWRQAVAQDATNREAYAAWRPGEPLRGPTDHTPHRRFIDSLLTKLQVDGFGLEVAGVKLHTKDVELNTALVAGSAPVQLAAKIHGWCESHCWVDGPDRTWLAGIIDQGIRTTLYRPDAGWEGLAEFLRARDDEPVVTSFSVTDGFPDAFVGDWMSAFPDGWDSLTDEQRQKHGARQDAWGELPGDEQWRISLSGLQAQPWLQLTPKSLTDATFHYPVTIYDLFASDRDQRVLAAAGWPRV